jgi:hypothetical protein
MKRAKNITIREQNRLKSPENGYKRRQTAFYRFDKWTTSDGVVFANANTTTTTFVMPTKAVTVTATYKDAPVTTYAVTVNSGTGGGNFAAGATVSITANAPATGKVFDKWTTTDGVVFANANNATTTFVMPAKAVTVAATYKDIPVSISGVVISPAATSVQKGTTQNFTAIVSGTGAYDSTVTWSVDGIAETTISETGLLTVAEGETATSLTVTATSTIDNTKSASATVTVTDTPVTTYAVTVNNGTGGGNYAEGSTVIITANAPATGKVFDKWTTTDG